MTTTSRIANFHPYCSVALQQKLTQITGLPPQEALQQLLAEEPHIKAISVRTGINRTQIYWAMAFFGIEPPPYDHGAYMRQWYAQQPPETSQRLTAEAHKASKGQDKPIEYLIERARYNQQHPRIYKGERKVLDILIANGIHCVPQLAMHIFNIDIGLPDHRIAIEVNGGNWHTTPKHLVGDAKKRSYLEAEGWTVVYFWGRLAEIEEQARLFVANSLPATQHHERSTVP